MRIFLIPKNHEYIRQLKQHLENIGMEVIVLKPFHYSSIMNIIKMIFYRTQGCKIIHVHWLYIFPFSFIMKWFYYFCKGIGLKIVWEMHNILPHGYTDHDKKNSRWFYEKSDAIIFHSRNDILRVQEMLDTSMYKTHIVIPHGNFNESYENSISKLDARRQLDIEDHARVILCFGFIRKNRGYEYLLEAVKGMGNTTIIIAGKIEDRDIYEKLLESKIRLPQLRLFVDWIPDDEVQLYFNACDIVVLPYTDITTSGVIPLAYAFSKPVITSAIGGLKDIVNEHTGILVPSKNAESLRDAINAMFNMDYDDMGRQAREYAEKNLNWDTNAQKISGLYRQLSDPLSDLIKQENQ
ncbi:MAG TPA: glycosyltransferase family 4 protein [Nitrospirota bacterium]|nr:glycosyltransferase family 4 protein [Nitrospirota bacterium]